MTDRDPLDVVALAADLIDPPSNRWVDDPAAWASERIDTFMWSRQRAIMESVRDHPRTAVHSCHSSGKSHVAAALVCWWLDVHPPGTAMVVTTAPTGAQVKGILWKYVNGMHAAAGLPGRVNQTEWLIGDRLVGIGRKPADYSPESFSGYHAEHVLVIIDESSGVSLGIFDALSTLVAGGHGRILAIGNPDHPVGPFRDACLPNSGWNVIGIGRDDMPSHTGEEVPEGVSRVLMSQEWADHCLTKWGADSALYQAKVLGRFPKQGSAFSVVPHDAATACRYLDTTGREGDAREAGVDLGAGGDRTVVRERVGMRAGRVREFRSPDPRATVGEIARVIAEWGVTRVKVDSIGIGWSMVGWLRDSVPSHVTVVPVNFSERPTPGNADRFANLRAEVWWTVGREMSMDRGWDLGECDDDTIAELTAPEYKIVDSRGKVLIEPKTDVIKRLGFSPDQADALLLAFWSPLLTARIDTSLPALMSTNLLAGR